MASTRRAWKDDILHQLKKRNKQQTTSYANLILASTCFSAAFSCSFLDSNVVCCF